jgi:hypothetical protein
MSVTNHFNHHYDLWEGWCILVGALTASITSFSFITEFEMMRIIDSLKKISYGRGGTGMTNKSLSFYFGWYVLILLL